jgi:hypothetical protein
LSRWKRIAVAFAGTVAVGVGIAVSSRIAPLLPAEGASVCYAGDFDGAQALTLGWPKQAKGSVHVSKLALRLDYPKGQTPYSDNNVGYGFDWRYEFTLLVKTVEGRDFVAGGQCDWSKGIANLVEWELSCFIDCDGGGISFTRFPLSRGLTASWEPDRWLRMASCGDGGQILRAGARAESFALKRDASGDCSDFSPDGSPK